MSEPQNTAVPLPPEKNPFVVDPFQGLDIDPARFDPDGVYRTYINVVNALGYFRSFQNKNHGSRIVLGTKKGEEYDALNVQRYELDYKLETLKEKKEAMEELFRNKRNEFRGAQKGGDFRWQ